MHLYTAPSGRLLMPPTHPEPMSREEAGAYFKKLRTDRKLRLQDVVDGTTLPNVQYLSALEGGRYNPLNSEHFPSLAKFFRLSREEIERIRPGTIVEIVAESAPVDSLTPPAPRRRSLPAALQQMIEEKQGLAPELADERWQQYLAGQRFSTGGATPERWWNLFLVLKNAGVEPGGN